MSKSEQNKNVAKEADQKLNAHFQDYSSRASSTANSEADLANQKIQEQFYGKSENNFLPFHIDVNNPPIKK
ncbi:hypothetical protein [Bacillus salipaludis]|uniref:hypothetical protein n=1 Tax=Bacillus salipaludis TaxID=2547811 RepID=UPI002E240A4E|nr:hypothetical protein [Bacillus salipaludis]